MRGETRRRLYCRYVSLPPQGFRRVVSRVGVRPVQHHLGTVVGAVAVHVFQTARVAGNSVIVHGCTPLYPPRSVCRVAGNQRQMRSVHDPTHFRHEPDHQHVRGPHARLQQGAGAVQPFRVVDLPVLADAHVELPRENDHQ